MAEGKPPATKSPRRTPQIDASQISAFLDLQKGELDIRAQELAIRQTEIQSNAKTAEKSIEAEREIQGLQQRHSLVVHGNRKILMLAGMACFFLTATVALFLDKESLVIELVKLAAIAVGSGLGGYAYGRIRNLPEQDGD